MLKNGLIGLTQVYCTLNPHEMVIYGNKTVLYENNSRIYGMSGKMIEVFLMHKKSFANSILSLVADEYVSLSTLAMNCSRKENVEVRIRNTSRIETLRRGIKNRTRPVVKKGETLN